MDLSSYIAGARARSHAEQRQIQVRRSRLLVALPVVARLLRESFGATEVVWFGSTARGEETAQSDLDHFADGVASEKFFSASAAVTRAVPWLAVDLVPRSHAPRALLDRVKDEGVAL